MALRLRSGTDEQRLLITPAEGELIYTTDTKSLYVGDGSTVGGLIINSAENLTLGELNDVDLITNPPATNQILKWDGANWVPGDDLGADLLNNIIQAGQDFRINIIADDSTRMVDVANNKFTGDLYGDIWDSSLTPGRVIDTNGRTGRLDIQKDDGTLILDHNTGSLYAQDNTVIVDGTIRAFFGDVDGSMRGSVFNEDLSIAIVNHLTGEITGDLTGSVFADDSTIVVDGLTGNVLGNVLNSLVETDTLTATTATATDANLENVTISKAGVPVLTITNNQPSVDLYDGDLHSVIIFKTIDTNGDRNSATMGTSDTLFTISKNDGAGNLPDANKLTISSDGKFGMGTIAPTATLDVEGSIKPGVYADAAARDAAIPQPVEGMLVYLQSTQKFIGYVSDIDLANGLPAGGAPGWMDLN